MFRRKESPSALASLRTLGLIKYSCEASQWSRYMTTRSVLQYLLQEILQTGSPLFEKPGPKLRYQALWWKDRHSGLKVGERADQLPSKVVKFRVAFPYVHKWSLSRAFCQQRPSLGAINGVRLTLNVSTRMFHTTNAPILVALPFTVT